MEELGPLFVSEFGFDQRGELDNNNNNNNDDRYKIGIDDKFLSCFMAHVAKLDLDWALWAWQGSYYYRQGQARSDEVFGVMNYNWSDVRNPLFSQRFHLLLTMLQGTSCLITLLFCFF